MLAMRRVGPLSTKQHEHGNSVQTTAPLTNASPALPGPCECADSLRGLRELVGAVERRGRRERETAARIRERRGGDMCKSLKM